MRRREFITILGGAAAVWPLAARAQQPGRLPTIGFLGASTPTAWTPYVVAFEERLRELGRIKDRTISIEYRWAEGRTERYAEIATEFVRLKVDVIVTAGSAVPTVKRATSTIPVIFAVGNDPVGSGLVASLARPGGNVTGLSLQTPDLSGKRLDLLRDARPNFRALAIMANIGVPAALLEMNELQAVARGLGLETIRLEIRRPEDITPAIEGLKGRADALYACADSLLNANRVRINTAAIAARLLTMYTAREYVEVGGLMSYGPKYPDLFRRAADFVDRILQGAKPADIPVEQPTKLELIINLATAKAIGLTIPEGFLLRADEVIE